MKEKKALGRGLSALISTPHPISDGGAAIKFPDTSEISATLNTDRGTGPEAQPGATTPLKLVNIELLSPNPNQPRREFSEQELDELADSIKQFGVLQPILVRSLGPDSYEIVAGERRWRAATRAGLREVPVLEKELSELEVLEISIVENVQRQNLNPIEEARSYERLSVEFGLSQEQIAQAVGKSRTVVANSLRVLKLPTEVLKLLEEQKLTVGHAKSILSVKEPSVQLGLAKKAIDEQLSVRSLEDIVSRIVTLDTKPQAPKSVVSSYTRGGAPFFSEIEDRLRRALGTKVTITQGRAGRGAIKVEYFSEEELERLVDKLIEGPGVDFPQSNR